MNIEKQREELHIQRKKTENMLKERLMHFIKLPCTIVIRDITPDLRIRFTMEISNAYVTRILANIKDQSRFIIDAESQKDDSGRTEFHYYIFDPNG